MHDIEPFYNWEVYYSSNDDERSPIYKAEYTEQYTHAIYNYYIHPLWDYIGSETLYIKVLFADYDEQVVVIELFGEWNDALHNDIMHLKRNVLDSMLAEGIRKFILIGENILNVHSSDDSYYEEWFEEVEDGWIAALNFREHILGEWEKFNLDYYLNFGGSLEVINWRTLTPHTFCKDVEDLIVKRIN